MSRRVNKAAFSVMLLATVTGLIGCQAKELDHPKAITYQDMNAYNAWVAAQKNKKDQEGFDAQPLQVNATGKVKAVPDIAVITARVSAKDLNESKALNEVSEAINAVQLSLKDRDVETGFTAVNSAVQMDQECINANALATQRNSQINSDHWFNKNLDLQGNEETKRRENKPRLTQTVCEVETVEVSTDMVIRVRPASEAGAVLQALGDANVSSGRLYGYDFSDYDALYQEAAEKAVFSARKKAEMIARVAQTELGEIKNFRVNGPSRTGRFGPQPNIVNRNRLANTAGQFTVFNGVSNQVVQSTQRVVQQNGEILASVMIPAQYQTVTETVVVQPQSVEYISTPPTYETVYETVVVQEASTDASGNVIPSVTKQEARRVIKTPASTQERVVPAITKQRTRRVLVSPAQTSAGKTATPSQSNALQMSLLSGPQTVSVTAYLSYDYMTPIDGTIVPAEGG